VPVKEQLIGKRAPAACTRRHLERPAQLENDDPWLKFFFLRFARAPFVKLHDSKEDNGQFQSDAAHVGRRLRTGAPLAATASSSDMETHDHARASGKASRIEFPHPVGRSDNLLIDCLSACAKVAPNCPWGGAANSLTVMTKRPLRFLAGF